MQVKQLRLVWFDPLLNEAQDSQAERFMQGVRYHLKDYGLTFVRCADAEAVYGEVTALVAAGRGQGVAPLVLLNACFAQNCALAHYLRAVAPGVCIVLRTPGYDEQTLMRALQSGADGYFSSEVSPHFLSTLLFSRIRSGGGYAPLFGHVETSVVPEHGWRFAEQAWAIVSPEGTRVRLTSTERAFLQVLISQPEMSAVHGVFIRQIWPDSKEAEENGRERLSVMVNRLRQKFKAKGLELPIRTIHGKGYMFSEPFLSLEAV